MKSFKILLFLLLFPLIAQTQGIGLPAGMGLLSLIGFLVLVFLAVIVIFLYKRTNNKRLFLIMFSVVVLTLTGWAKGYILFTSYKITDNNPLENPFKITVQKDSNYFEIEDGRIFEFTDEYYYTSKQKSIQVNKYIMLEKPDLKGEITVYSVGSTSDYYNYKNSIANVWITVPIFSKNIDKNSKKYEGKLHELKPDWKASERSLNKALTKSDCCDISWIKELIARGANDDQVVNKELLFHRFYSFADKKNYKQYRTQLIDTLLTAKGADINLKTLYGKTILHLTIDKIPGYQNAEFTDTDREYIQHLINSGVNLNIVDDEGRIPLHYALMKKNFPMSDLLVELGSNINLKDSSGQSPYAIAYKYYFGNDGKGNYFNISTQDKEDIGRMLKRMQFLRKQQSK